jgi:hypothetical protein
VKAAGLVQHRASGDVLDQTLSDEPIPVQVERFVGGQSAKPKGHDHHKITPVRLCSHDDNIPGQQ